ncbi:MAG: hypothetical protein IPP77_06720 [Bacteroidetes bacterium]|nr:hypothetical protein [Bacteroidota bacterium]
MKTSSSSFKWVALLICSLFGISAMAQNASGATMSSDVWCYIIGGATIMVLVALLFVMQKAALVLDENGQSLFDFDFPIFKKMAGEGKTVAIIMILIVLIGMYLVVTYSMG